MGRTYKDRRDHDHDARQRRVQYQKISKTEPTDDWEEDIRIEHEVDVIPDRRDNQ